MEKENQVLEVKDLQDYFIKTCEGFWESKNKDVVNKVQLLHNVEWFKSMIKHFKSNKAFCDFLKSIPITEETKNSKHALFIREYLTSFVSKDHKGVLLAPNYNKLLRFLNYTTYKHNYLFSLCFAEFEKEKLITIRRNVKTTGIVALSMKSEAKQKLVRDAIKVDDDGWSDYRVDERPYEFAWTDIRNIKDTIVSKFVKDNGRSLRNNFKKVWYGNKPLLQKASDKEMVGEYGILTSYSFKYGMNTLETYLSDFRGKIEAQQEIKKLSKRIVRNGNQSVINLLSEMLPDWSEADDDTRKNVLTFVNHRFFRSKRLNTKWLPLKQGIASDELKKEFIQKVESSLLAQ